MNDDALLRRLVAIAGVVPELFQFASPAAASQYRLLYRLFRRHVPAGAEVLDWGAGWGHFSWWLAHAGYRPCAFVFSAGEDFLLRPWMPKDGWRQVRGESADPVRLPLPDASFDAVASIGTLEHVRETGGTELGSLREVARILRPGGVFVCYHFPNRWSWIDAVAQRLGRDHHVWRYTRADIETLVRGAGLSLLDVRRYAFLPRNGCGRLPSPLRGSRGVAAAWDALDGLLQLVGSPLCHNYAFIARR